MRERERKKERKKERVIVCPSNLIHPTRQRKLITGKNLVLVPTIFIIPTFIH